MITMKKIIKILFAILILLIIFAGITTLLQKDILNGPGLDEYTTIIGNNSNGTVYKITCGNASSSDTAIMILGVHSLESGIHNATNETIMKFTKEHSLNKKFIVYFIKLNFNDSGMNTNPYIIVDAHEMESYWDTQRYVGIIDNKSSVTMEYAEKIGENLSYPVLKVKTGTSPKWVTKPLVKKNHNVILFETAQIDSQKNKTKTAIDLVRTIDKLPVY